MLDYAMIGQVLKFPIIKEAQYTAIFVRLCLFVIVIWEYLNHVYLSLLVGVLL